MNGRPVTSGALRRVLETMPDDAPVYVEIGSDRVPMLSVGTGREVVIGGSARGTACGQELKRLRRWLEAVSVGRATKETHAEIRAYLREAS